MPNQILRKMYEHHTWANLEVLRACASLTDTQLDAPVGPEAKGSIRTTLWHIASADQRYLSRLAAFQSPFAWEAPPSFEELEQSLVLTGAGLVALVDNQPEAQVRAGLDGVEYNMHSWVVMLQAINHGTEHREQVKSMMTAHGVTPPEVDGWTFGLAAGGMVRVAGDGGT